MLRTDCELNRLHPHVLQRVANTGVVPIFWSNNPTRMSARQSAVVFPSERLALRTAREELRMGRLWMITALTEEVVPPVSDGAVCLRCGYSDKHPWFHETPWATPTLCQACTAPEAIESWAVFQSTVDYPGLCVARRFLDAIPTSECMVEPALAALRNRKPPNLLTLPRSSTDDPNIVEVWI